MNISEPEKVESYIAEIYGLHLSMLATYLSKRSTVYLAYDIFRVLINKRLAIEYTYFQTIYFIDSMQAVDNPFPGDIAVQVQAYGYTKEMEHEFIFL